LHSNGYIAQSYESTPPGSIMASMLPKFPPWGSRRSYASISNLGRCVLPFFPHFFPSPLFQGALLAPHYWFTGRCEHRLAYLASLGVVCSMLPHYPWGEWGSKIG